MKFAINGFGRIGRNILRAKIERGISSLELVAINDMASHALRTRKGKGGGIESGKGGKGSGKSKG